MSCTGRRKRRIGIVGVEIGHFGLALIVSSNWIEVTVMSIVEWLIAVVISTCSLWKGTV